MVARKLSHYAMKANGFRDDDKLRKAITYRIVRALALQWKRARSDSPGFQMCVRVCGTC